MLFQDISLSLFRCLWLFTSRLSVSSQDLRSGQAGLSRSSQNSVLRSNPISLEEDFLEEEGRPSGVVAVAIVSRAIYIAASSNIDSSRARRHPRNRLRQRLQTPEEPSRIRLRRPSSWWKASRSVSLLVCGSLRREDARTRAHALVHSSSGGSGGEHSSPNGDDFPAASLPRAITNYSFNE